MVRAGGEDVDELEVGARFWSRREGGQCREDGYVFIDFCSGISLPMMKYIIVCQS